MRHISKVCKCRNKKVLSSTEIIVPSHQVPIPSPTDSDLCEHGLTGASNPVIHGVRSRMAAQFWLVSRNEATVRVSGWHQPSALRSMSATRAAKSATTTQPRPPSTATPRPAGQRTNQRQQRLGTSSFEACDCCGCHMSVFGLRQTNLSP